MCDCRCNWLDDLQLIANRRSFATNCNWIQWNGRLTTHLPRLPLASPIIHPKNQSKAITIYRFLYKSIKYFSINIIQYNLIINSIKFNQILSSTTLSNIKINIINIIQYNLIINSIKFYQIRPYQTLKINIINIIQY